MIFQIHDAKLRCKYYISVTKWKQYTCILLKIGVYVLKISNFCRGGNVTLVQAEFEYKATVGELDTEMSPPWLVTVSWTMGSPSPVPHDLRARPESTQ